jgi:S1-C subfamily serine protease
VILRFDGEEIAEPATLVLLLTRRAIGSTVTMEIVRDGRSRSLQVEVGRRPRAARPR